MTTHTLTIVDHPGDGEPIVSLDGGTYSYGPVLVPPSKSGPADRAALVRAVRDLTGPRDELPADLRDDRRIAWVPNAGDGEGAWCVPYLVRHRLYDEGWTFVPSGDYSLLRPPAPATEDVPWWEAIGRTHAGTGKVIACVKANESDVLCYAQPDGSEGWLADAHDDKVTVLKDTDR